MTLKQLRERAATLGVTIKADRFDVPLNGSIWGYYLEGTGWDDENYCTNHAEIKSSLDALELERSEIAKFKSGQPIKAMMPF
jgi:hypothetical protein